MKEIRVWKLRIIFGGYKPILFRKVKPPVDVYAANRRMERFLGTKTDGFEGNPS